MSEAAVKIVRGDFDDCRDALLDEIAGRGIVLTFHAHVSDMLARTAAATGTAAPVYRNAEIVGFCKADVSAAMLAANPDNIAHCPQAIMVYELADESGIIRIAYRKSSAPDETVEAAESLMAEIIEEACGENFN